MNLASLSLPNCKEIKHVVTDDSSRFGNRIYSWFFTRDKNIHADYRWRYLVTLAELSVNIPGLNAAAVCLKGAFTLATGDDSGKTAEYAMTGLQQNMIVVSGADEIRFTAQSEGAQLLLFTDKPLPDAGCAFSFTEAGNGIVRVQGKQADGITPLYDCDQFSAAGLSRAMTIGNYDSMRFADTFRGMYMQTGAREYFSYVNCTSGSMDICAIDMRKFSPDYRKSYIVHLDSASEGVFFQPGFALGFHSTSDDTGYLSFINNFFDRKFQRVINISECPAAEAFVRPGLIMSTLDRHADRLGEGQNLDI